MLVELLPRHSEQMFPAKAYARTHFLHTCLLARARYFHNEKNCHITATNIECPMRPRTRPEVHSFRAVGADGQLDLAKLF